MKKVLVSVTFAIAAFGASLPTIAADKAPGSGPNPYSDCGIGAALFAETGWAAATSNVIWDLGTTAVISATASPETCSGKRIKAAQFIGQTYNKLAEEAATGSGEHLTTVLNIMECGSSHHSEATRIIREGMSKSVADPKYIDQSPLDKASNFYGIVDQAVSAICVG